jgi:hypothetical protein
MLTPEEKRQELDKMGFTIEEKDAYIKAYIYLYNKYLLEEKDVFKTAAALDYINEALEGAGLVKHKKDRLTLTNIRELTTKAGRLAPLDRHAPKKIGFHYRKEELNKFIQTELEIRRTSKEALFLENQLLKARIVELEALLNDSQANTQGSIKKPKNEAVITAAQLSFDDGAELNFIYKKQRHFATFEGSELIGIEQEINAENGNRKPVSKQTYAKLEPLVIEARESLKNEQ